MGFVRAIGGGRRRVESVVYIANLQGSGSGELDGEEVVKGGLAAAGRGDKKAGLELDH